MRRDSRACLCVARDALAGPEEARRQVVYLIGKQGLAGWFAGGRWEGIGTVKCRNYIDWVIAAFLLGCFDSPEGFCVELSSLEYSG
jgi:hypothetical protein